MPEAESPQLRRDRMSAVVATSLVCVALPTVALLVSDVPNELRRVPLIWLAGSAVVGAIIPLLYWAPYRALGITGYVAIGWLIAAIYGVSTGHWAGWAHGLLLGLVIGALARGRHGATKVEENYLLAAAVLLGFGIAWGFVTGGRPFDRAGYFIVVIAVGLVWWAWTHLFRPLFELSVEPPLWLSFQIRAHGPGLAHIPRTGPCLVVANHACWFDPLILAKWLPRRITPMMTAAFYDLPILRRMMPAFEVIRVPEKAIKKETPEVDQAIAALERGECVVIFPEGYLRRSEDRPLRRFGRGVWQILQAQPRTPVFACWIEGTWGSYTSYAGGPPTKNKKRDFRRAVAVGIPKPVTVPPQVLADHLRTRLYVMNLVSAARTHLGLPALPPFEIGGNGEDPSYSDEPAL